MRFCFHPGLGEMFIAGECLGTSCSVSEERGASCPTSPITHRPCAIFNVELEHAGRSSGRTWEDLGLPFLKLISQLVEHPGILFAEVGLLSLID